ncbi:PH domain-containing protein [Mycoplasma todarodis]|uniref:Uncharacterized protein n=1 Tax=Mycoplasma todarodis TaxID=1937191 RepID=A0A4R0XUA6_9MOLU|nr:PH domain-containing protein [Mycoplasma todarodis]TCG11259.1 hypothetical protein C4B25_01980 [Mycoplasma todarodis]
MYRAIVVTVGVLVVFVMVLAITMMVRKKQVSNNFNPYLEEFESYQEDMMKNGYDISYESQPATMNDTEDLIYQLRSKISDVDFNLEAPETKPEPCTLWITNERLIAERRGVSKQSYAFEFEEIKEFEFELEKNKHAFIFEYKKQLFKFEVKDIYALALIELKTRIKRK